MPLLNSQQKIMDRFVSELNILISNTENQLDAAGVDDTLSAFCLSTDLVTQAVILSKSANSPDKFLHDLLMDRLRAWHKFNPD